MSPPAEFQQASMPKVSESATIANQHDALHARALGKKYGNNWVLRDAELVLKPGQVLALLGENGAGKSTLVKILSGAERADTGTVMIGGRSIPRGRPDLAKAAGFRIVYQEQSVCPDLSVEDNILLGQEVTRGSGLLNRRAGRARVMDVLQRLGHRDLDPKRMARTLSIGQQQLIEIARALLNDAKVLVLDEPTSSLARDDVRQLFETTRRLAKSGLAIIYISHFLEEVRELCDSYLVLRDGRVAGQGILANTSEAEIVQLMVGRSVDELFPKVSHTPSEDCLTLSMVSGAAMPKAVSFNVRRGEVFGLAGLIAAGRTETVRVISGLDPMRSGRIALDGRALDGSIANRIERGVAMVSEDRKREGLAQSMSIRDNATLSRLDPYSVGGILKRRSQTRAACDLIDRLRVNQKNPGFPVASLSGGNQQKVAIARALHQDATCLLFDEPTRGVDVGTKAEIYRLMGQAAADGKAVVFVSSYFRELLEICDRIAVMSRGRVVGIRDASRWTEHELLMASMGVSADDSVNV